MHRYIFFAYICNVLRRCLPISKRMGGADIWKGVYYALVLTVRNLVNFKRVSKNKATVNAPWVCYIYTLYALIAIGVSVHQWNYRYSGLLYISAWGFDVARF